jgi:hypothetical protein
LPKTKRIDPLIDRGELECCVNNPVGNPVSAATVGRSGPQTGGILHHPDRQIPEMLRRDLKARSFGFVGVGRLAVAHSLRLADQGVVGAPETVRDAEALQSAAAVLVEDPAWAEVVDHLQGGVQRWDRASNRRRIDCVFRTSTLPGRSSPPPAPWVTLDLPALTALH